jgi:asparagine synthase (glutamine-hydrolysing)
MSLAWPDATSKQLIQMAESSRIALTGMGADLALNARLGVHFRQLLGERRYFRMMADAVRYLSRPRRFSRLYLRARWRQLFPPVDSAELFPKWLNPDLEKTWSLRDRWEEVEGDHSHNKSARPEAFDLVANANWACHFEALDAGITQVPVEVRQPFFDLRLLNFLLALPRLPWCCDKELLREATRGSLPDAVRYRRKSPLAAEPLNLLLSKPESAWVDRFEPVPELDSFVDRRKIPPVFRERNAASAWINLRPLSLNFWLRGRENRCYKS